MCVRCLSCLRNSETVVTVVSKLLRSLHPMMHFSWRIGDMSELLGLSKLQAGTVLRSTARHIGNVEMEWWIGSQNQIGQQQSSLLKAYWSCPDVGLRVGLWHLILLLPPEHFLWLFFCIACRKFLKVLLTIRQGRCCGSDMVYDVYYDICIVL